MSFIIIFGALSFPVNISSSGLGLLINDYSSGGRCMDRGRRRVRRQAQRDRERERERLPTGRMRCVCAWEVGKMLRTNTCPRTRDQWGRARPIED